MLKVIKQSWKISRAQYKPQEFREECTAFLASKINNKQWIHRLQVVASELIANSCEHRFDDEEITFSIHLTCFHSSVRVQMILEDDSNLLIMQRHKNLRHAIQKRHQGAAMRGVHGRGLQIILHWTDDIQFSKKRSGGMKIKVVKIVPLELI